MNVLIVAVVIAGWLAVYLSSRSMLRRTAAQLRYEFQEQLKALSAAIQASGQATKEAPAVVAPMPALSAKTQVVDASQSPVETTPATADAAAVFEEVDSETLAVMAATFTAYLGKKVRVRSARALQAPYASNPWARQGRVMVQASHNLGQRER